MNKTHFVLGGDLKKSLTQGYHLDFKQLFKEAFTVTRKNYLPLITACLVTISIVVALYMFAFNVLSGLNENNQTLVNFVFSSFLVTPLVTGLQMMGIHHAIGLKSRPMDLFSFFKLILPLALASMAINVIAFLISLVFNAVLGEIGSHLSIVVMLYINMAFCMVGPLIVEKKLSAYLALQLSFKLVNKNLLQFTCLFLLIGVLAFIALIPSGLGMLLFIPFYFNLMGIVYRQICGIGVVATNVDDDNNDDDTPGGEEKPASTKSSLSKNDSEFEA